MRKEMPLVEIVKSEEFRNKIDEMKGSFFNHGFIFKNQRSQEISILRS